MAKKTILEFIAEKRTILFDLFHTLTSLESVRSGGLSTSEYLGISKQSWSEQLLEKSMERLIGALKDPFVIIKGMVHAINPDIPDQIIQNATQNRIERFKNALLAVPESTIRTLQTLKSMHKKIGLISNADVSEVYYWKESPLRLFFDSVVFSCEAGLAKPDPKIYEYSLRQLQERPENAVFVGDGGSDELCGAKQVGLSTVMITGIIEQLWPERIEPRKKHADYIIKNIDELINEKEI